MLGDFQTTSVPNIGCIIFTTKIAPMLIVWFFIYSPWYKYSR